MNNQKNAFDVDSIYIKEETLVALHKQFVEQLAQLAGEFMDADLRLSEKAMDALPYDRRTLYDTRSTGY